LTGQATISSTGAGLPLLGCSFHLVRQMRPRTENRRLVGSRFLKCCDQWALHPATRCAASFDKTLQRALNPLKVGKSGAHVYQLVLSLFAGLGAV
jgi:hypothetical protein